MLSAGCSYIPLMAPDSPAIILSSLTISQNKISSQLVQLVGPYSSGSLFVHLAFVLLFVSYCKLFGDWGPLTSLYLSLVSNTEQLDFEWTSEDDALIREATP